MQQSKSVPNRFKESLTPAERDLSFFLLKAKNILESPIPPAATYMERARKTYKEELAMNEKKRLQLLSIFQQLNK